MRGNAFQTDTNDYSHDSRITMDIFISLDDTQFVTNILRIFSKNVPVLYPPQFFKRGEFSRTFHAPWYPFRVWGGSKWWTWVHFFWFIQVTLTVLVAEVWVQYESWPSSVILCHVKPQSTPKIHGNLRILVLGGSSGNSPLVRVPAPYEVIVLYGLRTCKIRPTSGPTRGTT